MSSVGEFMILQALAAHAKQLKKLSALLTTSTEQIIQEIHMSQSQADADAAMIQQAIADLAAAVTNIEAEIAEYEAMHLPPVVSAS